jgi:hypothetical protein
LQLSIRWERIATKDSIALKFSSNKPIHFLRGAGGLSGEVQDMYKLYKPTMKTVFLDAEVKWSKDSNYTIKGH